MHNFLVHLNESACRKSGRLGPEQFQKSVLEYQIIDRESTIVTKPKMDLAVLDNEVV